jgi:DNA-binding NarL/FixJ family response regulator
MSTAPIRTFIVEDHPAMRGGVAAVLNQEEDIVVVGAATGGRQMWRMLRAMMPDVVLMDFDLDGEDGVFLCHRLKQLLDPPGVVVYSAYADRVLIAPAMLAHADALLSKRANASVICNAVRDASRRSVPPALPSDARERLNATLDDRELSLAALVLSRRPMKDLAVATGMTVDEVSAAVERMLRKLVPVRAGGSR